jgi:hypothetical protein
MSKQQYLQSGLLPQQHILLLSPSTLLEALGSVRDLRLQVPTLVGTAVHLLDASLRGCGVGEANGDDTLGLGIEQDDVLDFAELGALLASVLLDVFDEVFVFFDFLQGEDVLEDDDFVPAVGSGGDDGDLVLIPFCQAAVDLLLVRV